LRSGTVLSSRAAIFPIRQPSPRRCNTRWRSALASGKKLWSIIRNNNVDKMRRALEAAGVIFLDNGEGPGVKLRRGKD
jgi:hypothetical protein